MTGEPEPGSALSGVRVLDLGHGISGPFAARLLGDFGADVVKLEPPGGDSLRRRGPMVRDRSGGERSALFEYLNWNKRSVQLDLGEPRAHAAVRQLAEWANIVIVGFRPACLDAWQLPPSQLGDWNPNAVVAAVTDFGLDGPYRDYRASDLVIQAMGGIMQISGEAGREPIKPGLRQSYYLAGINCAYASLAAYFGRARGGGGTLIDISIVECAASELVMNQPFYAFTGVTQRRGTPQADPILTGQPIPVRDGYVALQGNTFIPMSDIADLFGDPRLYDQEFTTTAGRQRNFQRLRDLLAENLAAESGVEFFTRTCSKGLLAGVVQGASQLLDCAHLAARDHFHASPDLLAADGTPMRFPARLANLSVTPTSVRTGAPASGEHTDAVLDELATAAAGRRGDTVRADPAPPGSPDAPGPLSGLRVIDLSALFAVPYIGGLLADLGAEVIKVESPWRLDQSRAGYGATYENKPGTEFWNRANTFEVLNRGKRVICVDLRIGRRPGPAPPSCRWSRRHPRQLHAACASAVESHVRRAQQDQPPADHAIEHGLRLNRALVGVQISGHDARGHDGLDELHRLSGRPAVKSRPVSTRFHRVLDGTACADGCFDLSGAHRGRAVDRSRHVPARAERHPGSPARRATEWPGLRTPRGGGHRRPDQRGIPHVGG